MKQPAERALAADQRWKSSNDDGLWASPYTLKSGETQHHSLGHSLPSSDIPVQHFIRNNDAEMVTYVPAMADRPTVIRPY